MEVITFPESLLTSSGVYRFYCMTLFRSQTRRHYYDKIKLITFFSRIYHTYKIKITLKSDFWRQKVKILSLCMQRFCRRHFTT